MSLRNEVTKSLEVARKDKKIGNSIDAKVTVYLGDNLQPMRDAMANMDMAIEDFFIVSQFVVDDFANVPEDAEKAEGFDNLAIKINTASGKKCSRCWKYSETVGADAAHPDVCERCAKVLG